MWSRRPRAALVPIPHPHLGGLHRLAPGSALRPLFFPEQGTRGGNTVSSDCVPGEGPAGLRPAETPHRAPLSTRDPPARARAGHRPLLRVSQHSEHVGARVDETLAGHLGGVRQEPQQAPARDGAVVRRSGPVGQRTGVPHSHPHMRSGPHSPHSSTFQSQLPGHSLPALRCRRRLRRSGWDLGLCVSGSSPATGLGPLVPWPLPIVACHQVTGTC